MYYVASAELFDALRADEQAGLFPDAHAREAMGITGFTLPDACCAGSRPPKAAPPPCTPSRMATTWAAAQGEVVLAEAGLDGAAQAEAIMRYAEARAAAR